MNMDQTDVGGYISHLSELAGRSFSTTNEATEAILQLLSEQLGMRTSVLTRIPPEENRLEVLAAHNELDGCGIESGAVFPLPHTY